MATDYFKLTLILLVFYFTNLCGQSLNQECTNNYYDELNIKVITPVLRNEKSQINDILFKISNDSLTIGIFNSSEQDTLYLFDSYLVPDLLYSKYLHRYNKKNQECKLSFLPLLPYLSFQKSSPIIIGQNRIVNYFQIIYSFQIIPPNSLIEIQFPNNIFDTKYIKDFKAEELSKFDKVKIKNISQPKCKNQIIEFAIYDDISFFNEQDFYFNEKIFNEKALSYKLLRILIQ